MGKSGNEDFTLNLIVCTVTHFSPNPPPISRKDARPVLSAHFLEPWGRKLTLFIILSHRVNFNHMLTIGRAN